MKKGKNANVDQAVFKNGKFVNIENTPQLSKDASYYKIIKQGFNKPKNARPAEAIPAIVTNLKNLNASKPTFIWFGHSSYLLSCKDFNLLVDPVFSGSASPFSFMIKAYKGADYYKPEDMPNIDLHLQTHNHYDHLDKNSVMALSGQTMAYVVSKNMATDLKKWDIPINRIFELEWGEEVVVSKEVKITATPARHFSGRGLKRDTSLWNSYVLEFYGMKIFVGGDSGYGEHFKNIGKVFGPFDVAILECGQYGNYWPYIHMQPEETLRAAEDLNAEILIPVHWGKFTLSSHPWMEPIERLLAASENTATKIITPKIGQKVVLKSDYPTEKWWTD